MAQIIGNNSNNTLNGGVDRDYIYGNGGSDVLNGGAGNDVLFDDALDPGSINILNGDAGNDDIYAGISSKVDGGSGIDSLILSYKDQSIYRANITFTAAGQAAGTDGLFFKNIEGFQFLGSNANDSVNSGINTYGMTLNGNGGSDTLRGGLGNDYLYGGIGSDSLSGGAGVDVLVDDGIDVSSGLLAVDSLDGGAGNDRIYATAKSKTDGGLGNDLLVLSYGYQSTYRANITFTGAGQATGVDGVSFKNIEEFKFNGSDGIDSVNGSVNTYGMTLFAAAGNDVLRGGLANDVLNGGSGNDSLFGGGGNDILGDAFFDVTAGVVAVNSLDGGAGNDSIYAGIKCRVDGGTGQDYLEVSYAGQSIYSLNLTFTGAGQATGTDGISLKNVERFRLAGSETNDSINGSANTFTMNIYGNGGNDVVRGGLLGDLLSGNAGNDTLQGGGGNDSLGGGAGNDRFEFKGGTVAALGVDNISDFTVGVDKIVLSKATFGAINPAVGVLSSGSFAVVANDAAVGAASAAIVYSQSSGDLYYNSNLAAAGLGTGGRFVDLRSGLTLTASDFLVIA
jgi:Ca2+-binding RTX toxin-like protein